MLHSHPKFVHFCEVLEYKLYSIRDSVCIPAEVKVNSSDQVHVIASKSITEYHRKTQLLLPTKEHIIHEE